jgi:catechol 2,3-dioxygenase-like lactoylglutathione lyase family enzyme
VIEQISAVTLETGDMALAVSFYESLGFELKHGGRDAGFSTFHAGGGYLNIEMQSGYSPRSGWGRVIFYVGDVDAMYRRALDLGLTPSTTPRDAEWGERYFHLSDPDGHELSFARPL